MPSTTNWKLRRLAPRAKRVLARQQGAAPVIAAYTATLPNKADAFIKAYDTAAKYENTWRREMREGKGAVAALVKEMRGWLPLLKRDIPNFDTSSFADQPGVPDDVLEDGERLASVIEEGKDGDGKELTYKTAALNALLPAIASADKEWSEAEDADTTYQKLLATVRSTAAVFDLELQAFRRSLMHVLGRQNKDYQKLRAERASQKDEDDDPGAPNPPSPIEPAPEGVTEPKTSSS